MGVKYRSNIFLIDQHAAEAETIHPIVSVLGRHMVRMPTSRIVKEQMDITAHGNGSTTDTNNSSVSFF